MPTYEYTCESCGKHIEKFQKISAEPLTECPHCKGKLRRLISAGAGILFKGSGFHSTDYRNGGSSSKSAPPSCPDGKCPFSSD